jgi:hypothetical protein
MKTIRSEAKLYDYLLKMLASTEPKLRLNQRFVTFVELVAERGGWLDKENDIEGFCEEDDCDSGLPRASCLYVIVMRLTKGKKQAEISEDLVRFTMRIIETTIEDGVTGYDSAIPMLLYFLRFEGKDYLRISEEYPFDVCSTPKFEAEYEVRVRVKAKRRKETPSSEGDD